MNHDQITKFYGGGAKAAARIGVTRQTIHRWKTHGVPILKQLEIQRLSEGNLKADQRQVAKLRDLLGVQ